MSALADGINYLVAQSWASLFALFWFSILFDLPRYTFSFVAAAFFGEHAKAHWKPYEGKVSVILAGHNEADAIERCVRSLREQSHPPDEFIVISDGSTDAMASKLRELQNDGLIDQVHCTQLRAGKSAAVNLGFRWATGDALIIADCDCTYHRHALRRILQPLTDPEVGAVAGNIMVRNMVHGIVTRFQAIEYLISISLGKQAAALTDHVTCVSGAFGAFRTKALRQVAGYDVGGGEDLDLTLKMRKAGWGIEFVADSICFTDVPDSLRGLVRQRFRWERDAVRIRYRKHGDLLNPFSPTADLTEVAHEFEFLAFNVMAAAAMPIYLVWLFVTYGDFAWAILVAAQVGLLVIDTLSFALAAWTSPYGRWTGLIPYLPAYSLFSGLVMRNVRLAAYLQEWIFNSSADDEYVPAKVRLTRKW